VVDFGYGLQLVVSNKGLSLLAIFVFLFFPHFEELVELIQKFLSYVVELILFDLYFPVITCSSSTLVSL
jgi:mannitol-specific phosphotransferase system IIBC component